MRHKLPITLLVGAFASAAVAGDLPPGIGVVTPNGSTFSTEISTENSPNVSPNLDSDDYVFQGFPGMVLTAVAKPKKSALLPEIVVIRPDGSVVSDENGLTGTQTAKLASVKFTLDETGWWKVRVQGAFVSVDQQTGAVTRSSGAYSVNVKYTAPKLPAYPVVSKGFTQVAAITPGDLDEYAFPGYPGQTLSATLKLTKASPLIPLLQLIRPDGQVATTQGFGTKQTKLVIAQTLDQAGTWRLRVAGQEIDPAPPHKDISTGGYTMAVKLGKVATQRIAPDGNGQYRLTIPGTAGATISYTVNAAGPAPTFHSFQDPDGNVVPGVNAAVSLKGFRLPDGMPLGNYTLTLGAPSGSTAGITFASGISLPKGAKKRVATLASNEPVLRNNGVSPTAGGPQTRVIVQLINPIDANEPDAAFVGLELGHTPLLDVRLDNGGQSISGVVPSLPLGVYDIVAFSTTGQPAAAAKLFVRVPPPVAVSIDPTFGGDSGGYEVEIKGSNFRPGRMGVLIDGGLTAVSPFYTDETSVRFLAPPRAPGFVVFGVKDLDTQLPANLGINSFEYVSSASISRVVPGLIPTLGGELVTIQGANFDPRDHVYLETPTPGQYEELTGSGGQVTYVGSKQHRFVAPVRPKGIYRVHVQNYVNQPNPPKTRNLSYYSFADITGSTNLGTAGGADKYDAWTNAVADYDKDGNQDLILSRRGGAALGSVSHTRVVRNGGNGQFTDVTAGVMPAIDADDWRADRIWAADMNQDGYPDIVLATNSVDVPVEASSHTRILLNEVRGGGGAGATDRVFRDRTIDVMAPPRTSQLYGAFGGPATIYVSDNWRALDMWVGDIDKGGPGPPEIVITHDEVKDDDNPNNDVFLSGVYCGNYCSTTNQSFAYSYTFYWGGSRMFFWDKSARGGQGRFKFDPNFFPRASGPVVPQGGVPGGGQIPACSPHYNSLCKDAFTPFAGQKLAVGIVNDDGRPDVAVISNKQVKRADKLHYSPGTALITISSLQVGINKFNSAEGSGVTDMTIGLTSVVGALRGDSIAIGQPGYPDGNSDGVIAVSRAASSGSTTVLRLYKWKPGINVGEFEDITDLALPLPDSSGNDTFQASQIAWLDIDQDGDQDLVLLADAPPGGTQTALRIYRNESGSGKVGLLRRTLDPLFQAAVAASGDTLHGQALAIGDVTGDGLNDYVVSRATSTGNGSQTRIIKTDR